MEKEKKNDLHPQISSMEIETGEMEMPVKKNYRDTEISWEERKKARVSNLAEEGKRSCIYFLVTKKEKDDCGVKSLYVIDLNDKILCARKLEGSQLYTENRNLTVGSCGSLIYALGGSVMELQPDLHPTRPIPKVIPTAHFYDTADPAKGWFRGPDMLSPRICPTHQVSGSTIYVMAGAEPDIASYPWGEYLDVSNKDPQQWEWRSLELSACNVTDSHYPSYQCTFDEKFDPQQHVLSVLGPDDRIPLIYDISQKFLSRAPASLRFPRGRPLFFDGDYVFTSDTVDVYVVGVFDKGIMKIKSLFGVDWPWFCGGVEGMWNNSSLLPVGHLHISYDQWCVSCNPRAFSLVRIAPFKYATLWCPRSTEKDVKSCVRLSVFSASPDSPPLHDVDGLPLMPATLEVSDEHFMLEEYGCVFVEAALQCDYLLIARQHKSQKKKLKESVIEFPCGFSKIAVH